MNKVFITAIVFVALFSVVGSYSQKNGQDTLKFINYHNETWEKIQEFADSVNNPETPRKKTLIVDFSKVDVPKSYKDFKTAWYNEPVMQGATGTCWDFSTTSFFESEIYRVHAKKIKLSEIWTAYWEYVDKAARFVEQRGNSEFGEGSESNAVERIWKKYGVVPIEAYKGMPEGALYHNHIKLYSEMNNYLQSVKKNNAWNPAEVRATIISILNHYLGVPPETFTYNGKTYTPKEFLNQEVNLNFDDYVEFMSLGTEPWWTKTIYDVPDNWWKDSSYLNVPVGYFMKAINNAVKNGYTVCIGGDVSEAGLYSYADAAIVPSFDIPKQYIDDNARLFRFNNGTTGDDHGIHIVGWLEHGGDLWYLIKDSGSGARNGENKGYYFYREDFVKLKMLTCMMHKDAVKEVLNEVQSMKK